MILINQKVFTVFEAYTRREEHFTKLEDALKFKESKGYCMTNHLIREWEISVTIFESYDEYAESIDKDHIRKMALAKLTDAEKEALGV